MSLRRLALALAISAALFGAGCETCHHRPATAAAPCGCGAPPAVLPQSPYPPPIATAPALPPGQ